MAHICSIEIFSLLRHQIIVFLCVTIGCIPIHADERSTLRVGAAFEGGAYHEFATDLANALEILNSAAVQIENIATEGTVDSLGRLEEQALDLAIIQNDIGHYIYSGKYGYRTYDQFSALLPLFKEYIQIVVMQESDIRILGDLRQQVVAIGPKGSGIHRNALDILKEVGLRQSVDFQAVNIDPVEAFQRLRDGTIDAAFYTGANLPVEYDAKSEEFRSLPFSEELLSALTIARPYYSVSPNRSDVAAIGSDESVLSVTAYLVVGDHVPDETAAAAISTIVSVWPDLKGKDAKYDLIPLGESLLRRPFPYHHNATALFLELGLIEQSRSYFVLLAVTPLLFMLVWWANAECRTYDRLGNTNLGTRGWYPWLMVSVARAAIFIYIVLSFLLVVTALVYSIRYFETQYASNMNIENEFANIGFQEALLWMFMFMGSGETGDIFPLSTPGKILVTLIPAIGLSTLLGSFLIFAERQRKARSERLRGTVTKSVVGHVIICGWNEKVPGIIYSLTSSDAPEKKQVVVVAEMDGEAPLEQFTFDPKYVSYCRGNSSDHSSLQQASIGDADSALVVAGYRKQKNQNLESVLTVMALKEARRQVRGGHDKELYVAAEMIHDANREKFEICNVDALVHGTTIVDRMLAQCCFGSYMLDFVLDVLTYDNFDEVHSLRVPKLEKIPLKRVVQENALSQGIKQFCLLSVMRFSGRYDPWVLVDRSIDEAKLALAPRGVNLIGIVSSHKPYDALINHKFDSDSPFKLWLTKPHHVIKKSDTLIYCAADRHDIYSALANFQENVEHIWPVRGTFNWPSLEKRKVAIIGGDERVETVCQLFRGVPDSVELSTFAAPQTDQPHSVDDHLQVSVRAENVASVETGMSDIDVVLIANEMASSVTSTSDEDLRVIDANTLFTARQITRQLSNLADCQFRQRPMIIAQMVGRENRQLFQDAGIDVAIPRSLLVERVLTKLAYSKGDVANLLLALLTFDDGIYLQSVTVDSDRHAELIGKTYLDIMFGLPMTVQLIAWLPCDAREHLKNDKNDFDWHFITSPDLQQNQMHRCSADDVLILIMRREINENQKNKNDKS